MSTTAAVIIRAEVLYSHFSVPKALRLAAQDLGHKADSGEWETAFWACHVYIREAEQHGYKLSTPQVLAAVPRLWIAAELAELADLAE